MFKVNCLMIMLSLALSSVLFCDVSDKDGATILEIDSAVSSENMGNTTEVDEFEKYKRFLKMKSLKASLVKKETKGIDSSHLLADQKNSFIYGCDIGITMTTMEGSNLDDVHRGSGLTAGVFVDIPVLDDFYFSPGISLVNKNIGVGDTYISLSYIEIPMVIKYEMKRDRFLMSLKAGGYVGMAYRRDAVDVSSYYWESDDMSGLIEEIDLGVNLGISIRANDKYFGEIGYERSLVSVWKNEAVYNSSFFIKAGQVLRF